MKNNNTQISLLAQYFALSYLLLLLNASAFLVQIHYINFVSSIFAVTVFLAYGFIYIIPIFLALHLLKNIIDRFSSSVFLKSPWFTAIPSIIALTILQLFIYIDSFIFKMFGFHFNGFVWNLIFTKGGIESMGSSQSTMNSFIIRVVLFLAVQSTLFILLLKIQKIKNFLSSVLTQRRVQFAVLLLIMLLLVQGMAYGISSFYNYRPVLTVTKAFPFYVPVTFTRLAKSLGFVPPQQSAFNMKSKQIDLQYPLKPIHQDPNHNKYNIVFLMAESLRADMLNPKVMPYSWQFSQKSIRFNQHYSGGNGTRMGMFAAFYGLYGNYWFNFLEERKGPILLDLLIQDNYQINVFSSAKFSYPEFDKTIFAKLSPNLLHDSCELEKGLQGWKYDRLNTDKMLQFIDKRDKSRPFMTFMFFESPHALYHFPPENEIVKPYLEEFNYAEVDLKKDIQLIKNRYINSCNHLDSQFAKVLQYLQDNSLLDSTIVILTGDHGEEFMEKGRWGHNSTFSEEQTKTPLVLWVPGQTPRQIDSITSHLDISTTLLCLLGVTNSPDDYSDGFNLLAENIGRTYTVISGWDTIAYVDNENKAVFPMNVIGDQIVTTKSDAKVANEAQFYEKHKTVLVQIMKEMSRFSN